MGIIQAHYVLTIKPLIINFNQENPAFAKISWQLHSDTQAIPAANNTDLLITGMKANCLIVYDGMKMVGQRYHQPCSSINGQSQWD